MQSRLLLSLQMLILLSSIAPAGISSAQSRISHPSATDGAESARPVSVIECQGVNNCASWIFGNRVGSGEWQTTGEEAVLTLTSVAESNIVITRTDLRGSRAGLTATYIGKLQNGSISGTYVSKYQGSTEAGPWYLVESTPSNTPLTITEWESDGSAPVVWSFPTSGVGSRGTFASSAGGVIEPISIDHLDASTIVISRTETDPRWGGSAYYTGHIQGNKITGTVIYWEKGHVRSRNGTWHAEFGDVTTGQTVSRQQSTVTWNQALGAVHDGAVILGALSQFFGPSE